MKRDKFGRNSVLTTEEYITSLPESHRSKFDYSQTEYKGSGECITFQCKIHGKQSAQACRHKSSEFGCRACGKEANRLAKVNKGRSNFYRISKEIHGDKFDYSLVDYIKSTLKVKIICPIHGLFEQTPNSHTTVGTHGCLECSKVSATDKLKLTPREILKRSKAKFGDKFILDLSSYSSINSLVKITCPIHGEFVYKLCNHLSSEEGCPCCFEDKEKISHNRLSILESVERLGDVFDGQYHFFTEDIKISTDKVRYYCPIHKTLCSTQLKHLWDGHGCRQCGRDRGNLKLSGFYNKTIIERKKEFFKNDHNHLYLLHLELDKYKIGIAKDISTRIVSIKGQCPLIPKLVTKLAGNTYDIFYTEQELLSKYKDKQYIYEHKFKGYTEVLSLTPQDVECLIERIGGG